jgi:hypothetical protein
MYIHFRGIYISLNMKKEEREERRKASLRNSEIVMTLKIS